MSRKILQVGSDILTINDKLVSVKEDYPFWRVNVNTRTQYFNKLVTDLSPKYNMADISVPIDVGNAGGTAASTILAPNGSLYTCPLNSPNICKITPNPLNPLTPTIELIGNFGTTLFKWSSQHLVGDYIYFVPYNMTFILQLNWRTDTITQIGNFVGSSKWSAGDLTDDGRIFCPPFSSTDWLIININDPNNVTTTLHPRLQGSRGGCVNGGNGFMYTTHTEANNTFINTKINIVTLVETPVSVGSGLFRVATISKPFNFNGTLFYHGSNGIYSINTLNDALTLISTPVNAAQYYTPCLGADGWLYFTHTSSNYVNFRLNPQNLSTEITTVAASAYGGSTMALSNDGRMYGVGLTGIVLMRDTPVSETLVDNRLLSRYTNSK